MNLSVFALGLVCCFVAGWIAGEFGWKGILAMALAQLGMYLVVVS